MRRILDDYLNEISLAMVTSAVVLTKVAADIYNKYLSTTARRCKNFEGNLHAKCKITIKINGLKKYKQLLMKAMTKCSTSNDPMCKQKIKKKINKIDIELFKLMKDLKIIRRN